MLNINYMNVKSKIIFLCCLLVISNLVKSINIDNQANSTKRQYGFLENKGQLVDQNGNSRNDILYTTSNNGIKVFLKKNGFSYEVYKEVVRSKSEAFGSNWDQAIDKIKNTQVQYHRIDVELVGSNPNVLITPEEGFSDFVNYYDGDKEYRTIQHYKKLTYKNIYPNIDLVYHFTEQGVKYDFVVNAGGDYNSIQLKYNGMNSLALSPEGNVSIETALGTIVENIPESYTVSTIDNSSKNIDVDFVQNGNTISYTAMDYNRNHTLVIDPAILWSTYYGDLDKDEFYGVAKYSDSSIVVAGYTSSVNNIASTGAFQGTYGGGLFDAFVVRFNNLGVRKWATYYGAEAENVGTDVSTDGKGNIILVGFTESSAGIPTAGAHQVNYGGGTYDGFVTKFDSLGARLWSTYYGGTDLDIATTVASDSIGNIVVGGYSSSTSAIATTGSHQFVYGGGSSDGFVLNLNPNGVRQWATYYGGTDSDEVLGIVTDKLMQTIAFTGFSKSSMAIATPSAHQPSIGGDEDAFIALFDGAGIINWATYYGGLNTDQGQDIDMNPCGLAISGHTKSTSGIATLGVHQNVLNGMEDAFVAKFDLLGTREWGTYYGGTDVDKGFGIKVSPKSGYVAITGYTKSLMDIATIGAHQTSIGGGEDAFLADFTPTGLLRTASYMGGFQNDRGFGIAGNNTFYVSGFTESVDSVATAGGFQSSYGGGLYEGFLTRFVIKPRPLLPTPCSGSGVASVSDVDICENICLSFLGPQYDDDPNTNSFAWSFPGATPPFSSEQNPVNICYNTPGVFSVGLTVSNNAGLDILFWPNVITVNPLPVIDITTNDTTICPGSSVLLNATGGISYSWMPPTGLNNPNISNPIATPLVTTTYTVTGIDSSGCSNTDIITITVLPSVDAGLDTVICFGSNVQLNASSALSYSWTPSMWLSDSTIANPIASPQASITYYVTGTGNLGCQTTDSIHITVNQLPLVNAGSDASVCLGSTIQLNATGALSYIWTPASGLDNFVIANPVATVTNNITYTVLGTDSNGCLGLDSVTLTVLLLPTIAVSNDTTVCQGQTVNLSATGTSAFYLWSPPEGLNNATVSNPLATADSSITYTVTGTGANGCIVSDFVTINVLSLPVVDAGNDTTVCNGAIIALQASGGDTYLWGPSTGLSATNIANPSATISSSITYWVTSVGANGCSNSDSVIIATANDSAWSVDFIPSIDYCNLQVVFNASLSDSVNFLWSFGDGQTSIDFNPIHTYAEFNTTYSVTLIANTISGCYYTDTVTHIIPLDEAGFISSLILPNVFTPNGDGINELFQVDGIDCLPYYFEIFDRWGVKMFESDQTALAWNGSVNSGKPATDGVYYYLLHIGDSESEMNLKGFVHLVR